MLNGVRDQFVDDKAKRHREISADDERVDVDCNRPGLIGAARCRRDFLAKVDQIPVKRDRSDVVGQMKLVMNGCYGRNARGGVMELTCSGPCGVGVHMRNRLDTICKLFLMR